MPKSRGLSWIKLQDRINKRIAHSLISFDFNDGEIKTDLPLDIARWAEFRKTARLYLGAKFGKSSSWEIYNMWSFEVKGDLLVVIGHEEEEEREEESE